jgi:hypothetical protein
MYSDSIRAYCKKYKWGETQSEKNGYIEIHEGFNRTHFRIETCYDFLLNFLSNYSSTMKPLYSFFIIFVFIVVVTYLLSLVLIRIFTEKIRETGPTSVIVKLHKDGKRTNRFHIRKPLTKQKPVKIESFDTKKLVQKIRSPPKRQLKKKEPRNPRKIKERPTKPRKRVQENFSNPTHQGDRYLHRYARDYKDIIKKLHPSAT